MHEQQQAVPDPNIGLILQRMDQQDDKLDTMIEQVRTTNGRVKSLEIWQARLEGAKWAVSWAPPLVTAIASGGLGALLASYLT
jgi:hypothetical protein